MVFQIKLFIIITAVIGLGCSSDNPQNATYSPSIMNQGTSDMPSPQQSVMPQESPTTLTTANSSEKPGSSGQGVCLSAYAQYYEDELESNDVLLESSCDMIKYRNSATGVETTIKLSGCNMEITVKHNGREESMKYDVCSHQPVY